MGSERAADQERLYAYVTATGSVRIGSRPPAEPVCIFYDCKTTGLKIGWDRIIEIGAVVHPRHKVSHRSFDRLCCSSNREITPEAQALTSLTEDDLKGKPSVKDVLYEFFDWIKHIVREVRERERKPHVPVLVAHKGSQLEFPMLFKAVEGIGRRGRDNALQMKFNALSLHYVDTFEIFKTLKSSGMCGDELEKLEVTDIYKAYFGDRADGHRALNDAEDLCKIFTESSHAELFMSTLRKSILAKWELKVVQKKKFFKLEKSIFKPCEVTNMLEKGITYEDFIKNCSAPDHLFNSFMSDCGITEPSQIEDIIRFNQSYLFKQEKEQLLTMEQMDKFLQIKKKILDHHEVTQLLDKGITYEAIMAKSGSSEVDFRSFLETECGITKPNLLEDLVREFKTL